MRVEELRVESAALPPVDSAEPREVCAGGFRGSGRNAASPLEGSGRNVASPLGGSPLKTEGGSWLDWRDAWREMGRTEEEIAAEASARELAAEARVFVKGAGTGAEQARRRRRERERLHGFTRRRFDARCERLARLSGYIVKALLRGWRRDPLSARELFNMAWFTCCGRRLGSEAMARAWKDVWEWVRNIYLRIAGAAGLQDCIQKADTYSQSYSQGGEENAAGTEGASDGVGARVSETGKRPVKHCPPSTADAVCGLFADFRRKSIKAHEGMVEGEGFAGARRAGSTGRMRVEGLRVESAALPPVDSADPREVCSAPERIARYRGKLPGRCCWKVWEAMERLESFHWDATEHMWSARHAWTWLASLLAAGKSLRAAEGLYYDALVKWYGRRVSQEKNFVPSGMFAELYRDALHLPDFS